MQKWSGNYSEYLYRQILERNLLDHTAIVSSVGDISYKRFFEEINRAGNYLIGQGLAPRDRILLIMNDSPSLMYHFMGAIRVGIIPVILNTLLPPKEYPYYVEDSGASLCIVDESLSPKTTGCENLCRLIINSPATDHLTGCSTDLAFHSCGPDDPAFWQYSSGSTAGPKAVIHKHKAPIELFKIYAKNILNISSKDRLFSVSRAFFGYGLGNSLLFPSLAGATSILFEGPVNIPNVIDVVKRYKPTLFFSVPSFYAQLLAAEKNIHSFCQHASQIRCAVSAGEALPSSTYYIWKELTNIELLDGIGSTEALHIFMSNSSGSVRPGSCGKPLPGVEVKFAKIDDGDLSLENLRLLIKLDGLPNAYWQRPERTAKAFGDGWLDTGDIFRVDRDGYYWHVGRSDDVFKVKGMWVSPVEVEDSLIKNDYVADCAVVGLPDERGFTQVTAFVVLNDPAEEIAFSEQIPSHFEWLLASYKIPRQYHFITEIPRTTTGKKKRYELGRQPALSTIESH